MKIKPKSLIKLGSPRTTDFTLMYKRLTTKEKFVEPREVYLRPSMLPTCSIALLDQLISEEINEQGTWGFGADYFTSVGTTVHEFIESWVGHSGYKLWGHWVCPTCGHKHEYTHKCKCSKCGTIMAYHEIEIEYLGFKGHIDCIILTKNGVQICDYKTSTSGKVEYTDYKKHNMSYPLQILAYSYMLDKVWGSHFKKTYNLSVCGASLLFIARDNPFKVQEFNWSYKQCKNFGRQILMRSLIQFNCALTDFNGKKVRRVVSHKSCCNRTDYETREKLFYTYEDCPYVDLCFNKKRLDKYFKDRFALIKL